MDADNSGFSLNKSKEEPFKREQIVRSALKNFTNNPSSRFDESGGVSNKTNSGSGNDEDLKKVSFDCADRLSQNSLPSTPSRSSVVDTDTTDYESADEGHTSIEINQLTDILEKVHLSTPKPSEERSVDEDRKPFPFSPLDSPQTFNTSKISELNCSYDSVFDKTQYKSLVFSELNKTEYKSPINESTINNLKETHKNFKKIKFDLESVCPDANKKLNSSGDSNCSEPISLTLEDIKLNEDDFGDNNLNKSEKTLSEVYETDKTVTVATESKPKIIYTSCKPSVEENNENLQPIPLLKDTSKENHDFNIFVTNERGSAIDLCNTDCSLSISPVVGDNSVFYSSPFSDSDNLNQSKVNEQKQLSKSYDILKTSTDNVNNIRISDSKGSTSSLDIPVCSESDKNQEDNEYTNFEVAETVNTEKSSENKNFADKDFKFENETIVSNNSLCNLSKVNNIPDCLTFKVDSKEKSITNKYIDEIVSEEKSNLDENSEVFDLKQQNEFISTESSAVGAPVLPNTDFKFDSINFKNLNSNNIGEFVNQSLSSLVSDYNSKINDILVTDTDIDGCGFGEGKYSISDFSLLNISSASDKELQENIENCAAFLLEEISEPVDKIEQTKSIDDIVKEEVKTNELSTELPIITDDLNEVNSSTEVENIEKLQIINTLPIETNPVKVLNNSANNIENIAVLSESVEKDIECIQSAEDIVFDKSVINSENNFEEDIKNGLTIIQTNLNITPLSDNHIDVESNKFVELFEKNNKVTLSSEEVEEPLELEISNNVELEASSSNLSVISTGLKKEIEDIITEAKDIVNFKKFQQSETEKAFISEIRVGEDIKLAEDNKVCNDYVQENCILESAVEITSEIEIAKPCIDLEIHVKTDTKANINNINLAENIAEDKKICCDSIKENINKSVEIETEIKYQEDETDDKNLSYTLPNEISVEEVPELAGNSVHFVSNPNCVDHLTDSLEKLNITNKNKITEQICEDFTIADEKSSLKKKKSQQSLTSKSLSPITSSFHESLSVHESSSLNSPFSENINNRSYRDLSELIATCSKQERELAENQVFHTPEKFQVSFKAEASILSESLMEEDNKEDLFNQHMMQPPPSAEINNSEAGPITADEDFHKGEFFQEATEIDFSITPAKIASSLARKSLYIKFDPLLADAITAQAKKVPESLDNHFSNCINTMGDTKIGDVDVEKSPKRDRNKDDIKESQTLIMINTPGKTSTDLSGSEKLHNSSPSTPPNAIRRTIAGSGGTPSLRQEVSKLQDLMLEQEQAYVEQLAEKNDMIESLRKRVADIETKEPRAELEDKLNARELEVAKLRKEHSEMILSNQQLINIMEEYEQTIASSVRRREDEQIEFEKIKEKIANERDTALQHLTNMEVAFNDIHLKYERCKTLIDSLQNSEKHLQGVIDEQRQTIEQQKQEYEKLKQHAAEKINEANHEIGATHRNYKTEITKMKAVSKKAELRVKSLEESLERKKSEVKELAEICDELIEKIN